MNWHEFNASEAEAMARSGLFTLLVKKDEAGDMWVITSDNVVPGCRLTVIEHTLEDALASVPAAIERLKSDLSCTDNVITLPVIRVERFD